MKKTKILILIAAMTINPMTFAMDSSAKQQEDNSKDDDLNEGFAWVAALYFFMVIMAEEAR